MQQKKKKKKKRPRRRRHTVIIDAVYLDLVVLAVGRQRDVVEQRAQHVGEGATAWCCCCCCYCCRALLPLRVGRHGAYRTIVAGASMWAFQVAVYLGRCDAIGWPREASNGQGAHRQGSAAAGPLHQRSTPPTPRSANHSSTLDPSSSALALHLSATWTLPKYRETASQLTSTNSR